MSDYSDLIDVSKEKSRKKLQTLAKKYKLKANQSTVHLKQQLVALRTENTKGSPPVSPVSSPLPPPVPSPVSPKQEVEVASPPEEKQPEEAPLPLPSEDLVAAVLEAIDNTANADPQCVQVGDIVVRGPHWRKDNQDGGDGNRGVVKAVSDGWATVLWNSATRRRRYRNGNNIFDLNMVERPMPPSAVAALQQTSNYYTVV